MIWSRLFIWWQIRVDFLSKLGSSKKLLPSNYSLSPRNKIMGLSKREYSTSSRNSLNLNVIDNNESIKFDSLEQACQEIKFKYLGVSGVYILTNKNNVNRFYIGSSNNLARRMEEYLKLTIGLRNPHSSGELEISLTPASEWSLDFIHITSPQLSLVYEQYAIIMLRPSINSNYKVIPRVNPQWGNNLDNAIVGTEKLLSLFTVGSEGFERLSKFLQVFKTANNMKFEQEDLTNVYYCFLVFVYDITLLNKNPTIYSSINKALKGLQISYSNLLDHINNNYLFKSKFIISFEPIIAHDLKNYTEKPTGDSQLRKHITVYNKDNEILTEFKSAREMAKYFKVDTKVVRAALTKGEFQDFSLIVKEISNRKTVYVFDSDTLELIVELTGVSKAMKYAKVNFYTLKVLIENRKSYNGKIYSYKDKL